MAAATVDLVGQLGGEIASLDFLIELKALKGRDRLTGFNVHSMIDLSLVPKILGTRVLSNDL